MQGKKEECIQLRENLTILSSQPWCEWSNISNRSIVESNPLQIFADSEIATPIPPSCQKHYIITRTNDAFIIKWVTLLSSDCLSKARVSENWRFCSEITVIFSIFLLLCFSKIYSGLRNKINKASFMKWNEVALTG